MVEAKQPSSSSSNKSCPKEKKLSEFKIIDEVNYIDDNTRVIFITFNCYEPSNDRFITTQMIFEFTLAGMIIPHPIKIISFALDQAK